MYIQNDVLLIRNQVVKMKTKQGEFNYQHVDLHIHEVTCNFQVL